MGVHLKVDLERLGASAADLRHLYEEFSAAQDIVDDYRPGIGSEVLSRRLDDFVENWKHHRKWLLADLDLVAGAAQAASETYTGIEAELTQVLVENLSAGGVEV